jgi:hypothetical protein
MGLDPLKFINHSYSLHFLNVKHKPHKCMHNNLLYPFCIKFIVMEFLVMDASISQNKKRENRVIDRLSIAFHMNCVLI